MREKWAVFLRGFAFAAKGLQLAVLEERNFRFHLCAGFYVFLFSLFYSFTRAEYALLAVLVGGVLALELVNSALERAVWKPSAKKYEMAGMVKDMAAGAVLVFCIAAAVAGVFLFWNPTVFAAIFRFFAARLWLLGLLILSLFASGWFVFGFSVRPPKE